ncbi:TolC family outer membrane protein [Pseudomonas sp. CFBP 13711]|jgi:outer membrane protein|uniref:TolC family outer membrane protein n=1 Tax=unclassified Pseudomonas TaxID=196821 RepID=UPI0017876C0B|nr:MULTISPECIES: TolC family outer membrane protein [unclassified Pseudomonas]MBD8708421.1 TolC family outer membrane protein [Pseudomonas sp. CFBP 13711]MBD8714912.1 TolC family outer membrane protein [Pseudomonas sp. CFBP 13715]
MTVVRFLPGLFLGLFALNANAAQPEVPQQVSASTYSLDLMTLYKESRLEDPRILSAYAHARSAKQQEREAFGGLLPQVSASSNINRILRKDEQSREIYDNKSYGLNLSQFIYNKEAWERYQKAKSVTLQKASQSEDSQAEATVDLAKRYFAALAADDALELVSAERRATQGSLDRVNAMYAKQMAKITDMLDLKARVDSLLAQEIEARNQVRLSREGLSEIVGRPINDRLSRIRNDIALEAPTLPLDAWIAQALDSNPRLKAYESNLAAADAAVREGKGGHYPSLSFNLGASQSDVGYDNTLTPRSDSYVATIGLKVPIYSGGSTSARVSGLYDEQYAAEQDLEGVRRQVVKETTNAYLTAQSAVDKIRAGQNALSSAKQSSIAAQKAFTYGVVNAVDVLTAVQNEFKARSDLLKSQYDFITNLFILNRWAGKLSQESVASVNVWLGGDDSEALKDLNNSAPSNTKVTPK